MRLLIFGGRHLDSVEVASWLTANIETFIGTRPTHVIHGGYRGVDTGAHLYANVRQIPQTMFKADWTKHGKAAGPKRNQQMIDEGKPDMALALPGDRGTADMHRRCIIAGVPVVNVTWPQLKETGYVDGKD